MNLFKGVGKLLVCCACSILMVSVCKGEGALKITEKDYTPEVCSFMLQDNEPAKVMFDEEERSFKVNEPLQVCITKRRELFLRFYSPCAIRGVVVWAKIPEVNEFFKLAEFEMVLPFVEFRKKLSFFKTGGRYLTRSGKEIRLGSDLHIDPEDVKIELECADPFYQKVAASKCKWKVSFGDYVGKNWRRLLPAHAREAVAIALNMSYLFSSPEFSSELDKYENRLYSDNLLTVVDVNELKEKPFRLKKLMYGTVVGVNGLGGGHVFGLAEWCYLEHYADDNCETHTIFHEFAHCMGYNHTGNMTYENGFGQGWVYLCGELYTRMSVERRLPVYSRCFLDTRSCKKRYGLDFFQDPKYVIENTGSGVFAEDLYPHNH